MIDRPLIGVFPRSAYQSRERFFAALAAAEGADFEPRDSGLDGLAGAIVLPGSTTGGPELIGSGLPGVVAGARTALGASSVVVAESTRVDARLRGRVMPAERGAGVVEGLATGETIASAHDGRPLWVAGLAQPRVDSVAVAPPELDPDERLIDRLGADGWLGLVPLVELVRRLRPPITPRPLRAAFLVDDPNLHWTSYGFLKLPELIKHAERHQYHVSLGMVPIDGWWAHPRAVRLLRSHGDVLSLVVHGNDHIKAELARREGPLSARAAVAQALHRVERFERRYGVDVGRIMVAPHGICSEETAGELLATGYDAMCYSGPPPGDRAPESGWGIMGMTSRGLPVVPRLPLGSPEALMVLRAYVGHPLVLYGHHDDFAGGLGILEEAAASVRSLGDVSWSSLPAIAAASVQMRVAPANHHLCVDLYARRTSVAIPEDVRGVRVSVPAKTERSDTLVVDRRTNYPIGTGGSVDVAVDAGRREMHLELVSSHAIDVGRLPDPRWRPWPLIRRMLAEGRDRVAPLAARPWRRG